MDGLHNSMVFAVFLGGFFFSYNNKKKQIGKIILFITEVKIRNRFRCRHSVVLISCINHDCQQKVLTNITEPRCVGGWVGAWWGALRSRIL